jgi:acyl-CoA oxidase
LPLLARTIVYNFGHNRAKNIFANPKGSESEMVRIFCVVKCLVGWNLDHTSTICRERLGGGSYLSSAVIPEAISSAHSGMTAEGDNRVLMQKVVKDIFADVQKK